MRSSPEKNNQNIRVSIINCVSEALEMLRFSSEQLIENAGTDNFDYIIVCWNTTPEVDGYIVELSKKYIKTYPGIKIFRIDHKEISSIGYVPNLRAMINEGFNKAFELNQYGGLVNTDQAFFKDWLINLMKHCTHQRIVSSIVVMPKAILKHYQADFGLTEYRRFDSKGFQRFCNQITKPGKLRTEEDLKGNNYLYNVGFPYLFSREVWHKAGPWELTISKGTPDVNFFKRAYKYGFKYVVSLDSIAYHLEAGERGKTKKEAPTFAQKMQYEPISFLDKFKIKSKRGFYKLLKKLRVIKEEPIL